MSKKPILFNTDMVRGLLNGTKTVTRRLVQGAGADWDFLGIEERPYERRVKADGTEYPKEMDWPHAVFSAGDGYCDYPMIKAPYRPGDILYVRETWAPWSRTDGIAPEIHYKADGEMLPGVKWRPSIHMPREAARIFLRVTGVGVERLQDITEEQARAEGAEPFMMTVDVDKPDGEKRWKEILPALSMFPNLWDSTIKPADRDLYGWAANPRVWVIEFERISREEAEL